MKKVIIPILFIASFLFSISCRPSVVTDAKIEARYSYTSDQDAITGVLKDIYKIERRNNLPETANNLKSGFFDEEKEIGEWFKIKFGSEIRKGEAIKIIYTYKGENAGFDIVYKPYNNDVFPKNIISGYDFVMTLSNNGNESSASDNSPPDKPSANNSSSSPQSTSTPTNRLANTKWQYIHKYPELDLGYQIIPERDAKYTITFGQTSFSYDSNGHIISGSYTTNGDTINFTYVLFSENKKETGALIGNELSAFGIKFRRIE